MENENTGGRETDHLAAEDTDYSNGLKNTLSFVAIQSPRCFLLPNSIRISGEEPENLNF